MKLTIAFLSLFLGGHIHNINAFGYLQGSETQYLSHFDAIDSRSYAAADDPAVAPPTLQQCKNAGKQLDENAKETILQGEVISALAVQQQCSLDSVCVLPEGSIFEMTDNVNVGALIIRGSLVWNDDTANGKELALCAGYVAVEGQGSFQMTLKQTNGWIYVKNNGATHAQLRTRAFGATGEARVEISGRSLERTWTLLAKPFEIGSNQIHLLHDPAGMGWRKGDRIAIAPTKDMSQGEAQTFRIVDFQANGVVILDGTANDYYKADFIVAPKHPSQTKSPVVAMMSAEVTNLSCNIVITGDDFEHIPCEHNLPEAVIGEQTSMEGCKCSGFRSKCTMGLHTVHMYPGGVTRIQNTRIEKCGQRVSNICLGIYSVVVCHLPVYHTILTYLSLPFLDFDRASMVNIAYISIE